MALRTQFFFQILRNFQRILHLIEIRPGSEKCQSYNSKLWREENKRNEVSKCINRAADGNNRHNVFRLANKKKKNNKVRKRYFTPRHRYSCKLSRCRTKRVVTYTTVSDCHVTRRIYGISELS